MLQSVVHIDFADPGRQSHGLHNIESILRDQAGSAEIEVVCHGAGLGLLISDESAHGDLVAELIQKGIVAVACENTMHEKGIRPGDLVADVGTVSSGGRGDPETTGGVRLLQALTPGRFWGRPIPDRTSTAEEPDERDGEDGDHDSQNDGSQDRAGCWAGSLDRRAVGLPCRRVGRGQGVSGPELRSGPDFAARGAKQVGVGGGPPRARLWGLRISDPVSGSTPRSRW